MLRSDLSKIPQELKDLSQWVVWRIEPAKKGTPTKVPYNSGKPKAKASTKAPETWGTFPQAVSAAKSNGFGGVGFVFYEKDPYTGMDLDKCRDPQSGELKYCAQVILNYINSWPDVTPSKTGVHIISRAKWPAPTGKQKTMPCGMKIEVYDKLRFFTMPGIPLEGTPTTIEHRQAEIEALHQEIFGKHKPIPTDTGPSPTLDKTDVELIEMAKRAANGEKFSKLWSGDWSEYSSQSEADLALCQMLAYWTGKDYERIERIFGQSGLTRKKWDRPDYRLRTINAAIANTTKTYSPGGKRREDAKPTETKKATPTIDQEFHPSDWGNARRLVTLHGDKIRWCDLWQKWLIWDGMRWAEDNTREIEQLAKDVIRQLYREAAAAGDDERKALASYALKVEADSKQRAFLSQARSEPGIPVLPDHLDRNPLALQCDEWHHRPRHRKTAPPQTRRSDNQVGPG
jgi:putative DNA primase/helicase